MTVAHHIGLQMGYKIQPRPTWYMAAREVEPCCDRTVSLKRPSRSHRTVFLQRRALPSRAATAVKPLGACRFAKAGKPPEAIRFAAADELLVLNQLAASG